VTSDLAFAPALEQARLIREREASPVELCELYLDRIATHNGTLGAYLHVAGDLALAAAKRAEAATGEDGLSPLHGVCVSVKDLIDTADMPTTDGLFAWKDRMPDADAHVVTSVRESNMPILGKTTTPGFGTSVVSEPAGFPPARNPWNTDLSPGGSSGGAASALAAGLCAISIGSDGGGSVRIPSSWCGLFGIKPSRGRVSDAPHAQSWYGHTGPLARTVADAAALLDVLAGYVTGDAFWTPAPERPFLEEVGRDPGRLRIAMTAKHPNAGAETAAPNRQAAEEAASLLSDLGHEVVEAAPPPFDMIAAMIISAAGMGSRPDMPVEDLEPIDAMLVQMGRMAPASDLMRVMNDLQVQSRATIAFFDDYDLLLTPTVAEDPPHVGDFARLLQDAPQEVARMLDKVPFTPTWNQTGQPAVSIPLSMSEAGLPVGVQLVGRPADEATLIRVSAQLEQAKPWIDRRPQAFVETGV
jgi:amidase